MSFINNIYIDRLFVDDNNGNYYNVPSNRTYVPKNTNKKISKNTGIKWAIQLTNGSNVAIDINDITLKINTMYINKKNNNKINSKLLIFYPYNLGPNGSIIIGNIQLEDYKTNEYITKTHLIKYLSDQMIDNKIHVSTHFVLCGEDNNPIDQCGYSDVKNDDTCTDSVILSTTIGQDIINTSDPSGWNYSNGIKKFRYKQRIHMNSTIDQIGYYANEWHYGEIIGRKSLDSEFKISKLMGGCHISSLTNQQYTFSYIGSVRLYDNDNPRKNKSTPDNRLIINAVINNCIHKRWKSWAYTDKVYISHGNKDITLNTGFRGHPVSVINNNGFTITETSLKFDDSAKRYSFNTSFESVDADKIDRYKKRDPTVIIPEFIRNRIEINIDNKYIIVLENVNKYNLQPCRVKFMIKNKLYDRKHIGILNNEDYFDMCKISSLDDVSILKCISNDSINVTNASDPIKLNKYWE